MTLIKSKEEYIPQNNHYSLGERIKLEKFSSLIRETSLYLLKSAEPLLTIIVPSYYKSMDHFKFCNMHDICVAAGEGNISNIYVKEMIEIIFEKRNIQDLFSGDFDSSEKGRTMRYNEDAGIVTEESVSEYIHFMCDENYGSAPYVWRDDIEFDRNHMGIFRVIIDCARNIPGTSQEAGFCPEYTIFWNLFLTALDEEIYNSQLSNVIDLAYMLNFDENMIRDWCHAVEYVLNGNHLNENCNLHCDTDAGRWFFLHHNKYLKKLREDRGLI